MTATLTYEVLPTGSLRTFAKNPRHHSVQQVTRIADSIREFGFTNPVLVDEAGELIAGHGRLAAAQRLALETVPTIRINGLSAAQKRALRIADNRLAERSSWSANLLAEELKDLLDLDMDLELTGFDAIEIEAILTDDGDDAEDEAFVAPPPSTSVSRVGDLWALGPHRLLCGDAQASASYERVMEGGLADLVITDVPYNVPIVGNVSGLGRHHHGEFAMASGEMSPQQFREFLLKTLGLARDASRDGSLHYVFMDWRSIAELIGVGRDLYSELKNIVAWVKPNAGMGSFYRSQHELIAVFKHGHAPHVNNVQLGRLGRNRSNVWRYPGASGFSKARDADLSDHPTVKPEKLVADAIRDATMPADLVLDPFGGAGTALMAAEEVGRRAALIEIDPRYVDVTLRRFQEKTGLEPTLGADRTPLGAVRAKRLTEQEAAHV